MEKRILTLMMVVLMGIIIGVTVAVQKTTHPVMIQQLTEISRSLKSMEQRLVSIDSQMNDISKTFKNLQFPTQRVMGQPSGAPAAAPAEDFSKVYSIPAGDSFVRGNKNAKITIVEFLDFQCPFCQRFHQPILEVLKAYPQDVNYILKNYPLPFHQQARPAAKAALAAGEQGKYWEMVDSLLEVGVNLSDDGFKDIAKKVGLNVDKFMKDYKENDARWEQTLNNDMTLGSQVDVRGTPSFYINGRKTIARDLTAFKAEIDKIQNNK